MRGISQAADKMSALRGPYSTDLIALRRLHNEWRVPKSSAFIVLFVIHFQHNVYVPLPLVAQSKAWVCGRSPAEIVGSNPAEGVYICLL